MKCYGDRYKVRLHWSASASFTASAFLSPVAIPKMFTLGRARARVRVRYFNKVHGLYMAPASIRFFMKDADAVKDADAYGRGSVFTNAPLHSVKWYWNVWSSKYKWRRYYIPRIRRIGGCYGFTSKPPAARNGFNAIIQKPWDGLFSNLVYTLVVIVSWPD